jgi:hypothetical protein
MRYLRRRAAVLSDLPLLSVPVLELLGEPAPPAGQAVSSDDNFLMRQVYVQRALALRNAIESGDYSTLTSEDRKELLMLNASKAQCEKTGVPADWLTTVSQLTEKLTPFLPAEELAPVWQGIRSSPCYPLNSEIGKAVLAFFEVVALRQRDAIIAQGTALLADTKELSQGMQSNAILAVSAALLGGNDPQAGVKFLQQHGDYIAEYRNDNLPVRLVEAVAAMQQKNAAAGSGIASSK